MIRSAAPRRGPTGRHAGRLARRAGCARHPRAEVALSLPFTPEQFLDGFGRFNTAVWPLHLAAAGVAAATLMLAFRGGPRASRGGALGLAALWVAAASLQRFAFHDVMPTALPFAIAFLVQAALLALAGLRDKLAFRVRRGAVAALGLALVVYAAIAYPVVGAIAGHVWPRTPVFGVAPCPNTIFTFGLFLLTERPVPPWLLVIPFLWSLVGISAALLLGVPEDWGLPAAGILAVAVLAARDLPRRAHRPV